MKNPNPIRISDLRALPMSFITSTQAILAKKRRGKSYTAQVEAEELLELGQQIVVLDPTGAWWGLRAGADGKSPGYPITIFGGDHGDAPLEASAGEALATAIVAERFSAVIDLSLMRKGERLRFAADFLETLYRLNREAMHLFVDEADAFAPQKTFTPDQARCLGAADELVRRGGIKGIGVTMISQRPQVVNKDVLSQIDMLLVLQMNHPKDLDAIEDWIVDHVDKGAAREMMASLPSLPIGAAWIWAPEAGIFERVQIRKKRTYDSGRTPKAGERMKPPKKLAKVDLERIGKTMTAAVEEAKANDPKSLRARIAELVKERDAARAAKVKIKTVEKLIVPEGLAKKMLSAMEHVEHQAKKLDSGITVARAYVDDIRMLLAKATGSDPSLSAAAPAVAIHLPGVASTETAKAIARREAAPRARADLPGQGARSAPALQTRHESVLEPRQLRILTSVAWWESIGIRAPSAMGVAFIADYSPTSSSFEKARGLLRSRGLIDYPTPGSISLSPDGRTLAPPPPRAPSRAEFHRSVLEKLEPRQQRLLQPMLNVYPAEMSQDDLALSSGYSADSSSFEKARGLLRSLGLVEYPRPGFVRATDTLFPAGLR